MKMAPKRPRATKNEHEELAIQLYSPPIKRPEIAPAIPPVVVFAHGAGAPSTSEWMIRWRNLLAKALNPIEIVTFDYPYINGKRKAAPKPEKLVGFHTDVVKEAAAKYPEHPLILVGKSMGSRISCMVAAEIDILVSAIVCLGYPLKATNGVIRDETLLQLTVPIMFVQGGNDGFCPLASLEAVRKKLKAVNALHVIENGDHSFQIAKKNLELAGMTREEAEERAVEAVAMFVSQIRGEKVNKGSIKNSRCAASRMAKGILPQCVSRMDDHVGLHDAGVEQVKDIGKQACNLMKYCMIRNKDQFAKQPTRHARMRKSERILINKLKNPVYDKDGRGSTIDKPLNID
uniref:uncharacterized protein LOC122580572 isoform X2 n=1 Tax=Erigeron canadensis TaxID=72917 RepID=UPI001CB90334|nr:uncharacterized protein LOC122580572 isoform X2 [Erigeron canadensis]